MEEVAAAALRDGLPPTNWEDRQGWLPSDDGSLVLVHYPKDLLRGSSKNLCVMVPWTSDLSAAAAAAALASPLPISDESGRWYESPALPTLYAVSGAISTAHDTLLNISNRDPSGERPDPTVQQVLAAAFPTSVPCDPWGEPLRWMVFKERKFLLVYSVGPDRQALTLDDLGMAITYLYQ